MTLSPMMAQYWEIKNQYPDYLILFRVGDFFELFYEDSKIASSLLGLTLTKKNNGKQDEELSIPMAGMPHYIYLQYCYKLIMAGYKVVICDQMETPEEAKLAKRPIVQRSITKILTKSTIYYENYQWDDYNHFLMSITYNVNNKEFFIVITDISTNEFFYKSLNEDQLISFLAKINPEEIVLSKYDEQKIYLNNILRPFQNKIQWVATIDHIPLNDSWQKYKNSLRHYQQYNINTLITYLINHGINMDNCHHTPINFPFQETIGINNKTIKHLHLLPNGSGTDSIFQIIDGTSTPMGKRLLQKFLLFPSTNIDEIYNRQNKIQFFNKFLLNNVINLNNLGDLQKYLNNAIKKTIKPLELLKLAQGIQRIVDIFQILEKNNYPEKFNCQCYISQLILNTMEDEIYVAEGVIIKSNNLPILKDYNEKSQTIEHQLKILLDQYMMENKINIIKIKYDQRNGYFMESPKSQEKTIGSIDSFTIIQYGINYVRFISQEFINLTQQKQTYQQLSNQIHFNIFDQLLDKVKESYEEIENIIHHISSIDVFKGLSQLIHQYQWVFPTLENSDSLIIEEGYHPLVKHLINNFVSNDLIMVDGKNFHIITGPNMGGKTTFLRQNGIIVILAQMGCPVPAKKATIGIVDNIFTRIGADDDLIEGSSTFMVEMEEISHIIKQSTHKSLILIDELGRGTSVHDGVIIAQSIIEYLNNLHCRCLFSTHFHNLNELLHNQSIEYYYCGYRFDPHLIFTYKILKGMTDESFGVHVAQLAGLPDHIIKRCQQLLKNNLEKK